MDCYGNTIAGKASFKAGISRIRYEDDSHKRNPCDFRTGIYGASDVLFRQGEIALSRNASFAMRSFYMAIPPAPPAHALPLKIHEQIIKLFLRRRSVPIAAADYDILRLQGAQAPERTVLYLKKRILLCALALALFTSACAKQPEAEDIPPIVTITPEPLQTPAMQEHSTPEPSARVTPALPVITPGASGGETASPAPENPDELRYQDDRVGRIMDDTERFAASPRLAGSKAEKAALDYAAQVFASLGLTVGQQKVEQSGEYPFESYNIIGVRAAGKADAPILILAAHADSVEWSPGATDNAAGFATLLEAARQCSMLPGDSVEIRFIAFTAEEWQATGAKAYLSALPAAEKARVAGMLNLDMFSSAKANVCYAYFEDQNLCFDFWSDLTAAAERCGETLLLSRAHELMSDAKAFEEAGIPAVLLTHGVIDGEYHNADDVPDKIDQDKLLFALELSVEWMREALE